MTRVFVGLCVALLTFAMGVVTASLLKGGGDAGVRESVEAPAYQFEPVGPLTCEVHGTPTHSESVRIEFGERWYDAGEMEAERQLFPNSYSVVYTCVIDGEKRILMRVCQECRAAEKAWRASHTRRSIQFRR